MSLCCTDDSVSVVCVHTYVSIHALVACAGEHFDISSLLTVNINITQLHLSSYVMTENSSLSRPSHHHHRFCVVKDREPDAIVYQSFQQSGLQSCLKEFSPSEFGCNGVHTTEKSRVLLLVLWKVGIMRHLDAVGERKN